MMKNFKTVILSLFALMAFSTSSFAEVATSNVAVSGYDLVSYHNAKRPLRGNGHFVAYRNGTTYMFASQENLDAFNADPEKYLPAYGGYCAFGVSVGKKFVGDPEVWRLVDGKLYLNLDANIQSLWLEDVPGRIKTANKNWKDIRNKAAASL